MHIKQWAFFFVFLLSTEYIATTAAHLARVKRQTSCTLQPQVTSMFDKCFNDVRNQMPNSMSMPDTTTSSVQLAQGSISNLKNFKRTSELSCMCMGDRVKIFVQVSFIDITVTFLVTLLDSLLGGLLGNLGTTLARLVGQVVNLLLNILVLEINVLIAVDQPLSGGNCQLSEFQVQKITAIRILNIDLTQLLVGLLGDILTPVLNTLVTQLLSNQVRAIIASEVSKMKIPPEMINCSPY
ncbi:uncharacterized protein [Parasteatoda tepidariorum]|uniref:uncharacterized protein n=1 Tax=Parasteatoda tepidariorum TaxID=114398 RepID=UPI00077F82B2|nr:uncharacterized protein LOC107446347 [Parasteatoda tepidariorum]